MPQGECRTLGTSGEVTIYTVGQCARILNVSTKTLRHYDVVGLFGPAHVGDHNQYRYYSRDQLPVLRRIVSLRELGLGLEVIRELLWAGALDDPARVRVILNEHAEGLRREIDRQRDRLARVEHALAVAARDAASSAQVAWSVVVKRVPEVRGAGLRRAIPVREMQVLAGEAVRRLSEPPTGPRINVYYNLEFDPEFVDVEVLYPLAHGGDRVLAAATVATVLLVGLEAGAEIGEAYAAAYDWIEEHGACDAGPPREVLLVGPESGKPLSEQVIEIQVPIEGAN